ERAVPGDSSLDEMADAVELVTPLQVAVLVARGQDLDERVEVAVRALGGLDEPDRLVGHRLDPRVRRPPQLPAGALEPLVDVGVEERERLVEHDPERAVAVARELCREAEVLERAGGLELLEPGGDRRLAVDPGPL